MKPTAFMEIPEGGRFCPVFRSDGRLTTPDGEPRSALTHIYYTLNPGEISHFHRLRADEIWSLYRGAGLNLYLWNGTMKPPEVITLSAQSGAFCHAIPAGIWQAAEPLVDTLLVGCSVAPGFEEVDFELMLPRSESARRLTAIDPALSKFISL
ncbi:cupin domain-containing protein [Kistimonas scapharcae]|uniref:Cupin domain-containing protein n=1 Tax=Kistimonas scapharcae TaxID=1036133 RepID=A0ABP8V1B9_9GAMM